MESIYPNSLEKALAKTEGDVNATLKAAVSVVSSLKKFRIAIGTGNLRDLKKNNGIFGTGYCGIETTIYKYEGGMEF